MCLGIPAEIIEIEDEKAKVKVGGIIRKISLQLIENYKVGDYVLVHAGFAIQVIDKQKAKENLKLFDRLKE
jgi:hydrogenase expression/formation protein HypC